MINSIKAILVVMTFFSLSMTMLTYAFAGFGEETLTYVGDFNEINVKFQNQNISETLQGSIDSQTSIPVVEVGALLFYSGNLLIDLLFNFVFAIPQMVGLLVHGIQLLFNIEGYLFLQVQIVMSSLLIGLYVLGIIQTILNFRSGGQLV